MKTIRLTSKLFLLLVLSYVFPFSIQAQIAPDVTFSDIEGNNYNLYNILDDGYKVILVYGGYEEACWISEWQNAVGSEMWDLHGPDGDNTVRMFFIDETNIPSSSDESVAAYTEEMGVEYPVVNLDAPLPGYPIDGTPHFYAICLDKSFYQSGGFGEDVSYEQMAAFLLMCDGEDLSNDVYFKGLKDSPSFCTKGNEHTFIPEMYLMLSTQNTATNELNQAYSIYFYLNGAIQDTFSMSAPTGEYGIHADKPTLPLITLNSGDTLLYVLDYPNDTYSENNSFQYVIPFDLEDSPTTHTSINKLNLGNNGGAFSVKRPYEEGQHPDSALLYTFVDDMAPITLNDGDCYSIKFFNTNFTNVGLKDENDQAIITVNAPDFFPNNETSWLFFNVNSSVEIEDNKPIKAALNSVEYYNMLGKKVSNRMPLQTGVYIQLKHFKNKASESNKIFIKH
tara:strand:- start:6880 stop:8229 length:1350 start_codon:yes stop_codon:yes gene_type:complete